MINIFMQFYQRIKSSYMYVFEFIKQVRMKKVNEQ